MKLTIGFSPCPNDTFIFDALVNGLIDTEGLVFEPKLEDIQTLNAGAAKAKLDITKLSFPAFFPQAAQYAMLNSGAALGKGVGPLLVAKKMVDVGDIGRCKIAIPGELTTANFLLHYAFPFVKNTEPLLFSSIEDAVCDGEVELGVIIHENRFTYQQKGLHKICDLGEIWEQRENAPIPLAGITIKRSLPDEIKRKVERLIQKSVQYSLDRYPKLSAYITSHAQAMEEDVMRKHIQLYVNEYSVNLGPNGKAAIQAFFDVYTKMHGQSGKAEDLFLS
ncbi:1,4-dihydroxy-6-naphthoate synthase [Flavisolibacter nicotianae]|uniref:1,4-dihydroxy-6-naphthoate synthase n=1 Tax=Flavisolibacter nicotianae TaxID=2364882 RepID=UPI000EB34A79|nr:1,4-dihydroxy-6-naphthoate synthase [Flavisolibacter nicotianae]